VWTWDQSGAKSNTGRMKLTCSRCASHEVKICVGFAFPNRMGCEASPRRVGIHCSGRAVDPSVQSTRFMGLEASITASTFADAGVHWCA
jgi:hypothetical protein